MGSHGTFKVDQGSVFYVKGLMMTKKKVETCRPNNTLNRIIKGVFD